MKNFLLTTFIIFIYYLCFADNTPKNDVVWVISPNHTDWLYRTGEQAEIEVSVYKYGMQLQDAEISYQIGPDMLEAQSKGKVRLSKGKVIIKMGTLNKPGFLDCKLEATIDGHTSKDHIKVGFDPEKLVPYTQNPADFQSFWETAKQEAARCPMLVEKTFVKEFSDDKKDCYLVKLQAYRKGQFVYGYLTVPKREGKFPVVFSPPGAGVKPMDPTKDLFYSENGCIRFDMEIHGIRPNLDKEVYDEIKAAFDNYLVNGLDNRDNYYMKKVYMSCIRALDFLTSLPEWDGKNLIAQGGSQGGALALITTGLDSRITACAASHPALSDMAGYKAGRAGGYPHLFNKYNGMDTPEKIKTLEYYDVVNFARLIKVPVFMTWGYNDNVCPPTTSYIVYNTLTCPKDKLLTPINEHWISTDTRFFILEWIRTKLK